MGLPYEAGFKTGVDEHWTQISFDNREIALVLLNSASESVTPILSGTEKFNRALYLKIGSFCTGTKPREGRLRLRQKR